MPKNRAQELAAEINAALKAPALRMGSDPSFKVEYLPTGVLPIDVLLQGGVPRGRFITITGSFSTLKSLIGLRAIASTQARGGVCALVDTEHAFDPEWAQTLGVDTDTLILQHPESGELAIDTAEALVRGGCDLIVFDSVAAVLPEAERSKRLHSEPVQPARIAALMSQAMRKLTAANSRTAIIWINQMRMQVGVTFGNPERATGGLALPYYSSQIINLRQTGKVTNPVKVWDGDKWADSKTTVAQKFKATLEKSKLSAPHKEVHFVWDFETNSVDEIGYLISLGLESGAITRSGKDGVVWQCGQTTARGRAKFKAAVEADPALQATIRGSVSPGSLAAPSSEADKSSE